MKRKFIIGFIATMMFVNNCYQKQINAKAQINAVEINDLLQVGHMDRETRNYIYEEIEKTRKALTNAETFNWPTSGQEVVNVSANHENEINLTNFLTTVDVNSIPIQVRTESQNFVVEDGNIVYKTILDLMEFYVGRETIEKLMDFNHPMESLTEAGTQITGIKVKGIELDLNLIMGEEALTNEQGRRMLLYGQAEPQQTLIFDEDSSLWDITKEYNLTEAELYLLNPQMKGLKWADLLGMELDVTPLNPLITIDTEKEQAYVSPMGYETEYIEDETLLEGHFELVQPGQAGEVLTRMLTSFDGTEIIEEIITKKAVNEVVIRGTKVVTGIGNGEWMWPTTERSLTHDYLSHDGNYGIDITANLEQDVFAADHGVVVEASENSILINHKNGYYSRYSNLNTTEVFVGDVVESGQNIGTVGFEDENSYLHFEIRTNNNNQQTYAPNPLLFL